MYNTQDSKIVIEATLNSTAFNKSIDEIESKIEKLNDAKASLQIELDENNNEKIKNQIDSIEERLSELDIEKNIIISTTIDSQSISESIATTNEIIESSFEDMQNIIDNSIDTSSIATNFQKSLTIINSSFKTISSYASDLGTAIVNFLNVGIDSQLDTIEKNYNAEIDLLKSKYDTQDELYEEHLSNLTEMKKEYESNIADLEDEVDELEAEKQKIMSEEEYEALQQKIADKEAQIAEEQKLYEQATIDYQQTLDDQEQADLDYAAAKLEAEQEYQIEKATMERKAAENAKALNIFNATITMLQSIMQATLTGLQAGFPLSLGFVPAFTALAATTGALQIAAIAREPLPEIPTFAIGGYVNSEYANNYKAMGIAAPNNVDNTLAWLSTGERVLTQQQNRVYERMLTDSYITNHNNKSDISNTYNVSVNVAKTNSSSKAIAKAVVKAIGGKC